MSSNKKGASMAVAGASGAAAVAPQQTNLWILSPAWDLLLFVATPVLIVPVIFMAQTRWAAEEIYLFVASFGAVGHHLPGMIRAYGDRELFQRFKVRFVVAPLFLAVACLLFTLHDMSGIVLVVYLWGVWHGLMQTYGFLRIYDSKVKSFASVTSRIDHLMCLTWFGAAVILSPTRTQNILATFYDAGGPLIPGSVIAGAKTVAVVGLVAVTALFVINLLASWRRGTPPSPVKLLLMVISFGFWWYTNAIVGHILVGIALFEIFHDVQYLSIVWIFNQKRASDRKGSLSSFVRFLFGRSSALVGVYVGLVFAYGSMNLVAQGLPTENLKRALIGALLASTLLHFYYDGFIWKVREKSTRKSLGLTGGGENLAPGSLVHVMKWSLFVIPLAWLGVSEVQGVASARDRAQAIAEALPEFAEAQYNYGVELAAEGELEAAARHYSRAVELDPELGDAYHNLGNVLLAQKRTGDAIAMYRRSAEYLPESASARIHLGHALLEDGRTDEAVSEYRRAVDLQPENGEAQGGLANALAAAGRAEQALGHYRKAVAFDPGSARASFNLAWMLSSMGRRDEAIAEYRRAVELDPDLSEAQFNLANALMLTGRIETAIVHYREALRIGRDADVHFNLANALVHQGEPDEAIREYGRAIEMRPDFAEAHHNLGVAFLRVGHTEEAVARFREAIRLRPDYRDAQDNLENALAALRVQEGSRPRSLPDPGGG